MSEIQIDFAEQILQFLLSVACGAIMGVFYDFIKAPRLFFKPNSVKVFVWDMVFFILSALFTYLFLLAWCKGELRIYVVAGEVIGFVMYRILLSGTVIKVLLFLLKTVWKIQAPVKDLSARGFKRTEKALNKMSIKIKKDLKNLYKSLYNHKGGKRRKRSVNHEQINEQYFA